MAQDVISRLEPPDRAISWWTPPISSAGGFGYAAVNFIEALQRQGLRVEYNTEGPGVHVSWVQPPWYEGYNHQYLIGYTPWESSRLPKSWVRQMNERDEIWTPSWYNKEVYEDNGVTSPIHVVPHGVNPEHYPILRDQTVDGPFTFFHVGAPTERKGAQRVFDAFLDLFDGDLNVRLLMKSIGPSDGRYIDKYDIMHNVSYHPQVQVFEEEASIEIMRDLYSQAHCMVYPSNGEGFGFIPFQAIASGIPTISTNGTGMKDFAELSMPLNWKPCDGIGLHLGEWCDPDPDHLRELMLHVYNNWESEKLRALCSAEWLHENLTWDKVAEFTMGILGQKVRV